MVTKDSERGWFSQIGLIVGSLIRLLIPRPFGPKRLRREQANKQKQ